MKYLKYLGILVLLLALAACGAYLGRFELTRMNDGLPSFTHSEGETLEFMVEMADGVRLFTTAKLPDGEGPHPAVLLRSPYAQFGNVMRDQLCGRFARYGYACVYQDTRGQGKSEGDWLPMANEVSDGRDTMRWLADQSFQDGNIGMVGPSYLASVQFAVAAAGLPSEVKTFIPSVYTTDLREVVYSNGMFRHETFTAWSSMNRGTNTDVDGTGEDYQKAIRHLPHNEVDTEIFGVEMPWYQEMIDPAQFEASFLGNPDAELVQQVPENLSVPILMIGGWYDVFLGPQVDDWNRLATKSDSRFVLGPWTHIGSSGEAFEIDNAEGGLFQWKEMLPWLEYYLKGKGEQPTPGMYAYTMGVNEWRHHAQWPGEVTNKKWQLSGLAESKACNGGVLGDQPSTDQVSYDYDPLNPVPTSGGSGMLAFILPGYEGAKPANVLQEGFCEREDVLSFVSEPLDETMVLAGEVTVGLELSSSAPDTAFTVKLMEVFPDGRAINIRDDISSIAYRDDRLQPLSYTPDERMTLTISTWPVEWQLSSGSRLRLDISSSDFPKFHAHRNRAGPWAEQTGTDIATQTLYSGTLSLPIRP